MNNFFVDRKVYKLDFADRIDKAFSALPSNSFINKGRTGIGGTTLELNTPRRSIIVIPSVEAIRDKKQDINVANRENILGVYNGITVKDVEGHLRSDIPHIKLLVTPESFHKIIKAATSLQILSELYNSYFLLIDECHSMITESFREGILAPFNYFWSFSHKSVISATPFYFSDPRFRDLTEHKIEFTQKYLAPVTVIDAVSPKACLIHILQNCDSFRGPVHIFYNSIAQTVDAIKHSGITDCNIFIAEKDENMTKLGDLKCHYQSSPTACPKKKINFYTCKYAEGWDLHDEECTMLLVTDSYTPTLLQGIRTKLVQFIGRARNTPQNIIHITNHKKKDHMQDFEVIKSYYQEKAEEIIALYNDALRLDIPGMEYLIPFIDGCASKKEDGTYVFDSNKSDQILNQLYTEQVYNHIDLIIKEWKTNTIYEPVLKKFKKTLDQLLTSGRSKRISKAEKFKQVVQQIIEAEKEEPDLFSLGRTELESLKEACPSEYYAYKELGAEELERLNFNPKAINRAIIQKSNSSAEIKLLKLISSFFSEGGRYPKEYMKQQLQDFYDTLKIKDKNGRIKKATASHFSAWFDLKESKMKKADRLVNSYDIIGVKFLMAAIGSTS